MEMDTRCRSYLSHTSKQIANFPYAVVERPFELALDGADDSCPWPLTNAIPTSHSSMAECLDGPADAISPTQRDKVVESPIEDLPNELLNAILSEMEVLQLRNPLVPCIAQVEPLKDFKSCSLISRRWHALALPYVFRVIKLRLPSNRPSNLTAQTSESRRFLDFLRYSPGPASHIRKLQLSSAHRPYGAGNEAIMSLSFLRIIMQHIPLLREFWIEDFTMFMDLNLDAGPKDTMDQVYQPSKTLEKMTVCFPSSRTSSSEDALSWTLSLFSKIGTLSLVDYASDFEVPIDALAGPQADLSALHIDELNTWAENNINCMFSMLSNNNIASQLTSLVISFSDGVACNPMPFVAFLSEVRTNLQRLVLIWRSAFDMLAAFPEFETMLVHNLQACTVLRVLELHPYHFRNSKYAAIVNSVLLSAPQSLRHICLAAEWDGVLKSEHGLLWPVMQAVAQATPLKSLSLIPRIPRERPPRWESALAEATKKINAAIGRNVVYLEKQRCEMVGCDEGCYSTRR